MTYHVVHTVRKPGAFKFKKRAGFSWEGCVQATALIQCQTVETAAHSTSAVYLWELMFIKVIEVVCKTWPAAPVKIHRGKP